jgi:hypothetical protein
MPPAFTVGCRGLGWRGLRACPKVCFFSTTLGFREADFAAKPMGILDFVPIAIGIGFRDEGCLATPIIWFKIVRTIYVKPSVIDCL